MCVFTAVSLQREEWVRLSDAQKRRDLCHELQSRLNDLLKDQEVLSKYVASSASTLISWPASRL